MELVIIWRRDKLEGGMQKQLNKHEPSPGKEERVRKRLKITLS